MNKHNIIVKHAIFRVHESIARLVSINVIWVFLAFLFSVFIQGQRNHGRNLNSPPNILLILADDLGAESLGSYGCTNFKTPHLDKLAESGARFENCYATPLCIPSRMQIMTGRYPFRTGWTSNKWGKERFFDANREISFANILNAAGYATCIVDKWMLSYDFKDKPEIFKEAGFDEHYMWRLWDTSIPEEKRVSSNNPITPGTWDAEIWKDGPVDDGLGKYAPDLFCDYLINFMKRNRDRPFLAYWPMHLVHTETFYGKTTPPTPDSFSVHPDKTGKSIYKQKGMADMILYMDKLVGRLIEALDVLGIRENTLILFTGDNGTTEGIVSKQANKHIVGGKGKLSEEGCRVPLIANWKGQIKEDVVLTDLVDFTDFLPTMAEAAQTELPVDNRIDGVSFLPQLRGKKGTPRKWIYSQLGLRWLIRDKNWMLYNDGQIVDISQRYLPKMKSSAKSKRAKKRLSKELDKLRSQIK